MRNLLRDLWNLARDPLLTAVYRPVQLVPYYMPGGLWYESTPSFGRSVLFAIPGPYHPLEVLAAVRGAWPLASADYTTVFAVGESRKQKLYDLRDISNALYITTETTALLFHLFTPINTNAGPLCVRSSQVLYEAAGIPAQRAIDAHFNRLDGPCRMDFWGGDDWKRGAVRVDYMRLLETI